ncbi:uncharacterized protein LOC111915193 [Lactuca sativa]|uniref:Uncharacterized protein n=1 Tax=Lactuca sativa TaxID=4236 RepID=A0A9R1WQ60_LACSA|nr:uncharacterized protein LOC111915193 [Lactuca sativa]KAJ0226118.1 hypothetical protein LSAT_V11C100022090 [Lactuca sativa]
MGENAEKDLDVKASGAVNDGCLSQGDELVIDVTSSSTLTEDRSSGSVNETSLEQLRTTEIDADKTIEIAQPSEQIEEMANLKSGTIELDADKTFEIAQPSEQIEEMANLKSGTTELEADKTIEIAQPSEQIEEMANLKLGTTELDADKTADMAHTSEQIEEIPKLIETQEPKRIGKNTKFNLRKSLAWDSAFFTSDGVLDADELSTMIERGEKGMKNQLPGIEEEVYRSMESISTLESDSLTLECLEAELFEDIRASIQKSNTKSNLNNDSTIKVQSGKKDSQAKISISKKVLDLDSGKRPAARIKDNSTSSIPKPKIISKVSSTSALTKRASLSTNQAKKDQDFLKQAHATHKGIQSAKTTTNGVINPRRGVPKPSLTSKSSSSSSSTTCSNSSSFSGNDSTFLRKKVDSKNGNKFTAGPIPKTPSRVNTKNKVPPVNSRLSFHTTLSNLSSSVSPASSIDLSSESSSSTSITRRSIESIDSALSVHNHATGWNKNENGNQISSLSRPPSVQPTGLRMPSPKIGFFDGGKSGVRTPNGGGNAIRSQTRVPTSSNGVNKIPPPKTGFMKPNPQKTGSKQPSQEQPKTSLNLCLNPTDSDSNKSKMETFDSSRTPFAVKNSVCEVSESGLTMEVLEKGVDFSFVESQHKENSEFI